MTDTPRKLRQSRSLFHNLTPEQLKALREFDWDAFHAKHGTIYCGIPTKE